jgi:hypothetical protein
MRLNRKWFVTTLAMIALGFLCLFVANYVSGMAFDAHGTDPDLFFFFAGIVFCWGCARIDPEEDDDEDDDTEGK